MKNLFILSKQIGSTLWHYFSDYFPMIIIGFAIGFIMWIALHMILSFLG